MEHLKILRKEKNLYQKDVAEHLGIDRTTYAKYEAGVSEMSHETLKRLSAFFGVSTDYLLDLTDDPIASGGPLAAYIRQQRGAESEEAFAERCNISVGLLQKIERGLCQDKPSTLSTKYICLTKDQIISIANGLQLPDWRYIECLYFCVNPNNVKYPQPLPEPLQTSGDLPERVMIPPDDRTKAFPTWLPSDSSGIYLTAEEQRLLHTYRTADDHARQMVDLALEPFAESSVPPAQSDKAI